MDCPHSTSCLWEPGAPVSGCQTCVACFALWSCGTAAG